MSKRKFLTTLLTLAMVAALLVGLTVMAGAEAPHIHDGVTFETPIGDFAALEALFDNGGSGYLTADIAVPASTGLVPKAGTTVSLCLNGRSINFDQYSRFNVYGTLNIYGYEGGTITKCSAICGGGVAVYEAKNSNLGNPCMSMSATPV